MGRGGLVAYVEAELERKIALGQLHPSGQFASEVELARRMNVCRGTMREALRRLAARGLVVQRPGCKTRAVALDESLTLENLGLALHDARSPNARWLLEGYFSLRRQVLVELLVDCCAKASERDMDQLGSLCFRLWDAAKWESGERCAQVEFELLRLAARVAERPGHVLLVQSLQRAFLGGASRLLPFMDGEALRQWVICAQEALRERDTGRLLHELPTLMKACDEQVLEQFAPAPQEPDSREPYRDDGGLPGDRASATAQVDAVEARPCVEACGPDRLTPTSKHDGVLKELSGREAHGLDGLRLDTEQHGALAAGRDLEMQGLEGLALIIEQGSALEEHCLGGSAVAVAESEGLEAAGGLHGQDLLGEQHSGGLLSPPSIGLVPCEAGGVCSGESREVALGDLSDGQTGLGASCPAECLQSEAPAGGACGFPRAAVPKAGGPLHVIQGLRRGGWASRLWPFMARFVGWLV